MVRSVVETLSFGRMIGRVSERRYALRDLSGSMKEEYLSHFKVNADVPIRGGWLRYDRNANQYILRDADVPGRISHRQLQEVSGVTISDYFSGRSFDQTKDKEKAARRKYDMFWEQHKSEWFEESKDFVHALDDAGRKIYEVAQFVRENETTSPGRIVMTGQPGPRKQVTDRRSGELKWTGKQYEFVFWDSGRSQDIVVSDQTVEDFKFAYFDDSPKDQSVDYKWRSEQLKSGEEIPVFWKRGVAHDGQPSVKHFGLSYLYKLPYDNTVEESIKNFQRKTAEAYDLADAIFGMVGTKENQASTAYLKGRVQFSHAKTTTDVKVNKEEKVILGEPRASFYPTYMQQPVRENGKTGSYKTFMDDAPIAGRKRYPVLEGETRQTRTKDEKGKPLSEAVFTKFLPLDTGTEFTCEVSYHNLREIELGALLSGLTFHGSDKSRHQIGMAKPLGFGKVKVSVTGLADEEQADLMLRYEAFMDYALGGVDTWRNSEQIKELVALTTPANRSAIEVLEGTFPYNALGEFKKVKNDREALRAHSAMRGEDEEFTPGLKTDADKKQRLRDEIRADKTAFDLIEPMTPERAKQMTTSADEQVRKDLRKVAEAKITAYRQQLTELKAKADLAATEDRRYKEKVAATKRGLDLSGVKPARDAFKKLKQQTDKYLAQRQSITTNKLTAENRLLPETDWKEFTDKLKEIFANKQARKKSFSGKQLARTKLETQWYLGEEATISLFQELK